MVKVEFSSDIQEICLLLGDVALDFSGKKVLLAGGMGFLGRYFQSVFRYLNENTLTTPCQVLVLDNFITSGSAAESQVEDSNLKFIRADIAKGVEVDGNIDYIINLAGIASPYYYRAYPVETLDVAVNGTRHLLDLAKRKSAKFTFFSSSEIYGDPDAKHVPTPESYRGNVSCRGPRACYDESKRLGETLCYVYSTSFGVHTNCIRPFNIYGPGMQEKDYRVLPNFASCLKKGKPVKLYGSGNQTRTFCYITDAINGFLRVVTRGVAGEVYNIGNPDPEVSIFDLVECMEGVIGQEIDKQVVEYPDSYPPDEPMRRCPDITKAALQLSYKPKIGLPEGLQRFLDWTSETYSS